MRLPPIICEDMGIFDLTAGRLSILIIWNENCSPAGIAGKILERHRAVW
jgi:hypothetical protein